MKVRVIRFSDFEEFCDENGLEIGINQLTDEQFMDIFNDTESDWVFDSLNDFAYEFNTDGAYAPTPSDHIIRFFPNE